MGGWDPTKKKSGPTRTWSRSPICLQTLGVKLLEYGQLFRAAREHTTLIAQAVGPQEVLGLACFVSGENKPCAKKNPRI